MNPWMRLRLGAVEKGSSVSIPATGYCKQYLGESQWHPRPLDPRTTHLTQSFCSLPSASWRELLVTSRKVRPPASVSFAKASRSYMLSAVDERETQGFGRKSQGERTAGQGAVMRRGQMTRERVTRGRVTRGREETRKTERRKTERRRESRRGGAARTLLQGPEKQTVCLSHMCTREGDDAARSDGRGPFPNTRSADGCLHGQRGSASPLRVLQQPVTARNTCSGVVCVCFSRGEQVRGSKTVLEIEGSRYELDVRKVTCGAGG